jgi:site-specific DNA-adenine methylase
MGINNYFGGKASYSAKISRVIHDVRKHEREYIEPFCGWCSVLERVVLSEGFEKYTASDVNESVATFWKEISDGTFVPPTEFITKEEWIRLKKEKTPSAMQAFVGICYSFDGGWFRGYSPKYAPHNFKNPDNISKVLVKRGDAMRDVSFSCCDYTEYVDREGCFFYMDPPYETRTEHYRFNDFEINRFDSGAFWDFTRKLSEKNTVIISEYMAPDDFECIAEFPGKRKGKTEKLFKTKT